MASYKPTAGMKEDAQRALEWRSEFGRGGTEVGIARARDIVNDKNLSEDTVKRMFSFFSRHEVDKQAEGFRPGEKGYPSNGRIAWGLWGGDAGFSWSREIVERIKKEEERAEDLSESIMTGLKTKADEHNEKVGDVASKRTSVRTLAAVFRRGVGAYKTNPQSVRPGVTGPDQWAYARVNSFLYALRNGKFRSGKHDTDLLPSGHPMSSKGKKESDMEETIKRHVIDVQETEDAYIVTFGKSMPDDMPEVEADEREEETVEERFERTDMETRYHHMEDDDRNIDSETRRVRVGVSTEEPVERSFGMEVIDHSKGSMNLEFLNSGRAPLLLDHDMTKQIGVIERVELDEEARRLRAVVRFGKGPLASEVFSDVEDGIRQNISVGYRIDGRVEREGDPEDYVRVATTPMEISIVSVPADQSSQVGVGRSVSEPLTETPSDETEIVMSEEIKNVTVDVEAAKAEAVRAARKNDAEILRLASKHNKRDLGEVAIRDGVSADEFRGQLLDIIGDEKPLETPANVVDAPAKETRAYSLGRMVQAQITGDWRKAGLEREINDEIAKNVGREAEGVYVPDFAWQQRGPLSTAATGGSASEVVFDDFVPTEHRGDMFIEALRAKQVLGGLGTTYMSGLTNRVKMPKLATGANAGFVEELEDVTDGAGTDGSLVLQPRTMGAFVDMSRLLMLESVPAIEQIIRNDLLASAADRTEYHAINGSGSGGQPTGILNTSGINNLDISTGTDVDALTWADIIQLVKLVEEDNGIVNGNAAGFLSHPAVKAKLASTARVASTDSVMILNEPWNTLYGNPIAFTSNVPTNLDPGDAGNDASALVYGDFSQLIIASFGAPSILVDPYSNSKAGTVRMVLHAELDVGVRNAVSFAKTDEVSVA